LSRLRAFSFDRGVGDGDGEADPRSAELRGEEPAETAAAPGLALDLNLSLVVGHHAGIAPAPTVREEGRAAPTGAGAGGRVFRRGEIELEPPVERGEEGRETACRARKARGRSRRRLAL
jgi:hypothetical protein